MDLVEEQPPSPRKQPQQERSQRMVAAIIDACKKILLEHSEESLSLPLLESVSGVTKGSIYQYFPNLEAIVAALYDRELEDSVARGLSQMEARKGQSSLEQELRILIEQSLGWHKTIYSLHSSFYTRYSLHYDIGKRFVALYGDLEVAKNYIAPLLVRQFNDPPLADPVVTAHLMMQLLINVFRSTLRYYPGLIHTPQYQRQLLATCLAFVSSAPRVGP
jgi:AcrR family transcriptional regulator